MSIWSAWNDKSVDSAVLQFCSSTERNCWTIPYNCHYERSSASASFVCHTAGKYSSIRITTRGGCALKTWLAWYRYLILLSFEVSSDILALTWLGNSLIPRTAVKTGRDEGTSNPFKQNVLTHTPIRWLVRTFFIFFSPSVFETLGSVYPDGISCLFHGCQCGMG